MVNSFELKRTFMVFYMKHFVKLSILFIMAGVIFNTACAPSELEEIGFTLTIIGGSGSGNHPEGTRVAILANPAQVNEVFDRWIGDIEFVENVRSTSTHVNMPPRDITIMATFRHIGM